LPEAVRKYATGVSLGQTESSTQTASRSLQPFLQGSVGDRPTGRPTDQATVSVTIGGAHSWTTGMNHCWPSMLQTHTALSNILEHEASRGSSAKLNLSLCWPSLALNVI